MRADYRYFSIRPNYGRRAFGLSQHFYAPTLMDAFVQARITWPGAESWECLGSVRHPEAWR